MTAPMNLESVTTRPALPTAEDGFLFAVFANDITRGAFARLFGREYGRILERSFVEPHHEMSYQTTTFAELDGNAVGMVSAHVPGPDVPPPWDRLRLEPGGRLYERLGLRVISRYPRLVLVPPIVLGMMKEL